MRIYWIRLDFQELQAPCQGKCHWVWLNRNKHSHQYITVNWVKSWLAALTFTTLAHLLGICVFIWTAWQSRLGLSCFHFHYFNVDVSIGQWQDDAETVLWMINWHWLQQLQQVTKMATATKLIMHTVHRQCGCNTHKKYIWFCHHNFGNNKDILMIFGTQIIKTMMILISKK